MTSSIRSAMVAATRRPALVTLYAFGVSHVLVPIFSKQTHPRHWEDNAARAYAAAQGATVIVSNSLVLARMKGTVGDVGVGHNRQAPVERSGPNRWDESPGRDDARYRDRQRDWLSVP